MSIFKKKETKNPNHVAYTVSTDRFDDIFVNEGETTIAVFARKDNTFRLQKISDLRLYTKCVVTIKQFYPEGVFEK